MIQQFTKGLIAAAILMFFAGCKEEKTDFNADFEASDVSIGVGQYVNFEDASIGGVTAWSWTFEGGQPSTSTDKDPDGILYAAAGSYDVTLTITTDEGTASETKKDYIVVEQLPGGCGTTSIVTDIDGNSYSVVTIGSQCWLGENLKVTHFRDGSAIPVVTDGTAWKNLMSPAMVSYNNDNANDATYGKLYNWYAIGDPRGICPEGWHVPHDYEWQVLTKYLDPENDFAGGRMKEAGTEHWMAPNAGANNSSGFTGLPGGMRFREGQFEFMGQNGLFWSTREDGDFEGYFLTLTHYSPEAHRTVIYKQSGFSCRCVKD